MIFNRGTLATFALAGVIQAAASGSGLALPGADARRTIVFEGSASVAATGTADASRATKAEGVSTLISTAMGEGDAFNNTLIDSSWTFCRAHVFGTTNETFRSTVECTADGSDAFERVIRMDEGLETSDGVAEIVVAPEVVFEVAGSAATSAVPLADFALDTGGQHIVDFSSFLNVSTSLVVNTIAFAQEQVKFGGSAEMTGELQLISHPSGSCAATSAVNQLIASNHWKPVRIQQPWLVSGVAAPVVAPQRRVKAFGTLLAEGDPSNGGLQVKTTAKGIATATVTGNFGKLRPAVGTVSAVATVTPATPAVNYAAASDLAIAVSIITGYNRVNDYTATGPENTVFVDPDEADVIVAPDEDKVIVV